jgi:hypothetical protein
MKTIVYHSGALGDFISIIPVLRIWKMHTASPIDIISKKAHYTLTNHFKLTDGGIDIDSAAIARLFAGNCTDVVSFINTYSHAILFASESSQLVKNFRSGFNGVLYCHDPLPRGEIHCADYQLSIIDPIKSMYAPEFRIPCIPFGNEKTVTSNRVCIHTGSGSRLKNWDFKNYLKLSELLKCKGYTICWIRGFAEMSEHYPDDDCAYTVDSLIDLSIFLRDSLLFIGNDSGISHLAAACGCKVVSLFGPSDPTVWAPAGCNDICIVYDKKSCSPCHLRGGTTDNGCNRTCLNSISVNTVAECCIKLISNL